MHRLLIFALVLTTGAFASSTRDFTEHPICLCDGSACHAIGVVTLGDRGVPKRRLRLVDSITSRILADVKTDSAGYYDADFESHVGAVLVEHPVDFWGDTPSMTCRAGGVSVGSPIRSSE